MVLVTAKKTARQAAAHSSEPGRASSLNAKHPRIIKKYPNRRLYDTASSAYITLSQVKQFIVDAKPFEVKDAKSGEDLTRSILLQIILEEEMGGMPLFSEATLIHMIRFYGHTMQGFMGQMIEKNMQSFMDIQAQFPANAAASSLAGMGNLPGMNQFMGSFLEQSQGLAKQIQDQMLAAMGVKRPS